jgi:hypothetical protein
VKVTGHQGIHLKIVSTHRSSEDQEASKPAQVCWDFLVHKGLKVQEVNEDCLATQVNLDHLEILVLLVEAVAQWNLETLNLQLHLTSRKMFMPLSFQNSMAQLKCSTSGYPRTITSIHMVMEQNLPRL